MVRRQAGFKVPVEYRGCEGDDEAEEVGCRRALTMAGVSWPEGPGVLLFVSMLIASSAPGIGADGQCCLLKT